MNLNTRSVSLAFLFIVNSWC